MKMLNMLRLTCLGSMNSGPTLLEELVYIPTETTLSQYRAFSELQSRIHMQGWSLLICSGCPKELMAFREPTVIQDFFDHAMASAILSANEDIDFVMREVTKHSLLDVISWDKIVWTVVSSSKNISQT